MSERRPVRCRRRQGCKDWRCTVIGIWIVDVWRILTEWGNYVVVGTEALP